jgi:[ribosomal protein S18]-alanine N-acetyltransferase
VESPITIRRLAPSDADAILEIQFRCPELAQWSKRDYEEITEGVTAGWVGSKIANDPSSAGVAVIVGFITARVAADEIEILNLGVDPAERRRGVARSLLKAAFAWGVENHVRRAFLEVRASNVAAIQFYKTFGFQTAGLRPKYYNSPIEDALQLSALIE